MKIIIGSIIALSFFSGCMMQNPYKQFFSKAMDSGIPLQDSVNNPSISVVNRSEFLSQKEYLRKQGFVLLGDSEFSAGEVLTRNDQAIAHAKNIGASHILIARSYEGTRSGNLSLTTPTQNTTYHSGNVNLYGTDGSFNTGSYYGSSTTYGTQTTNIPYSVTRYNVLASFFGSPVNQSDARKIISEQKSLGEKLQNDEISVKEYLRLKKELESDFRDDKPKVKSSLNNQESKKLRNNFSADRKKEARSRLIRLYTSGAITREEYDQMVKEIK